MKEQLRDQAFQLAEWITLMRTTELEEKASSMIFELIRKVDLYGNLLMEARYEIDGNIDKIRELEERLGITRETKLTTFAELKAQIKT